MGSVGEEGQEIRTGGGTRGSCLEVCEGGRARGQGGDGGPRTASAASARFRSAAASRASPGERSIPPASKSTVYRGDPGAYAWPPPPGWRGGFPAGVPLAAEASLGSTAFAKSARALTADSAAFFGVDLAPAGGLASALGFSDPSAGSFSLTGGGDSSARAPATEGRWSIWNHHCFWSRRALQSWSVVLSSMHSRTQRRSQPPRSEAAGWLQRIEAASERTLQHGIVDLVDETGDCIQEVAPHSRAPRLSGRSRHPNERAGGRAARSGLDLGTAESPHG